MKSFKSYNILIISAFPSSYSAGLGEDLINALKKNGHNVLFFSRCDLKVTRMEKILSGIKSKLKSILPTTLSFLSAKIYYFFYPYKVISPLTNGIRFVYKDENIPSVPIERLCKSITGNYDYVITLFWQEMLTTRSLKALWDKLHCPILIYAVDMAPMTGGCYYFNKCRNFEKGCGTCPGLDSSDLNDKSHENYLTKKTNYSGMDCAFLGNTWMLQFAKASHLFDNSLLCKMEIVIDQDQFNLTEKVLKARHKFGIDDKKRFILLARSDKDPRKGSRFIITAIKSFVESLPAQVRNEVLVLTVGDTTIKDALHYTLINHLHVGILSKKDLISAYQSAVYFLNASTDDAGPSMINQSILCGTPVICFDNGAALDVIENGISGFKCPTGSEEGFVCCLKEAYSITPTQYQQLRGSTRRKGLEHNSYSVCAKNFDEIFSLFPKSNPISASK